MKELLLPFSTAGHQFARVVGERISNTPIDYALEQMISSVNPNLRDEIIARFIEFYFQFGPGNSPKTGAGKAGFRRWLEHGIEGRRVTFAAYAPKWLDGFKINPIGKEYITNNSGIFVTNHPTGPFRGYWICFALNYTVNQLNGEGKSPSWMTTDFSARDSVLSSTSFLRLLRERASHIWADPGDVFFVSSNRKRREMAMLDITDHLNQEGSMAITIEGPNNHKLTRARIVVGKIVQQLSQDDKIPVWPVGLWREGDDLNVRFGSNIDLSDLSDYQTIADQIAIHIANLLPEERRGVYTNAAKLLDKKE